MSVFNFFKNNSLVIPGAVLVTNIVVASAARMIGKDYVEKSNIQPFCMFGYIERGSSAEEGENSTPRSRIIPKHS
jgi:hypothetical protein